MIEIVHRCLLYHFVLGLPDIQRSSDVAPAGTCVPPYPPDLTLRDEEGRPLYEIFGLQLTITVQMDSGELFYVERNGPLPIEVGDRWPTE